MGLRTLIVKYNDSGHLDDAIYYIETNQTKLRVADLNDALKWAGRNPKDYRGKDRKIEELLDYLKNEYMN